jgi:hypothetical protein
MKSAFLVLAALLFSFSAKAQNQPALDQLFPGYHPTVFHSYDEMKNVFDHHMPLGFKTGTWGRVSQCYQRAELWSYNLYRNLQINPMKVFIFYTHTYRRAYDFDWWFHVAPYTLVRNPSTQQLEEYVLDPIFVDEPLTMKPWTDLFLESHRKCAEFVPFEKFRREVENGPDAVYGKEHCYIVRVPATDYDPTDVEAREAGQKSGYQYDMDELQQAVNYAPSNGMKAYWRNLLGL